MSFYVSGRLWVVISVILFTVVIAGAVIIWIRLPRSQAVEISLAPEREYGTSIAVSGAVNNPGIYSLKTGDTIATVLKIAGGTTADADISHINLSVPCKGIAEDVQKVDINHAASWLLEALPGIGEILAQRIIAYRAQNGPFQNINEITRVNGMTLNTYEKIKNYITVTD
jgi:competence protein ComEA